ncbi:Brf1-like TBP-binding domain-containing protein [Pyrenochaeta sp. MPI-SDFR-AT-0127]|nr:Brf1-like TBP-binding domain-containing protein [Pyrenochaeta sp. MPI-SDFR-AT-0127]
MSTPTVARPPRARLLGLNPAKKAPGPAWSYTSETTKRKTLPAPPPPVQKQRPKCCDSPNITDEDGSTMCYTCGRVFEESSIVAEVTFGETAGGAAMVEGGFISDNQRHANSMGGTMRGLGGMESREQAAMHGRHAIEALAQSLQVRQAVVDQAVGWYKLAMNHNFIQGRRMRNVAAVAIYMAARRQPENTLMLMDLAEKIQTNVWTLGDTYKAFLKKLGEEDPAQLVGNKAVQEIEPLMLKYCRKLEFFEDSHKVADDACKLLRCMSREWMVQGRQPAGICGACIILAARMNNYRRTTREVVYVVKVADSTINARLYEFKRIPASVLSVNQFREFGQRLKVKTQPPAVWRRAEKEERKEKRKLAEERALKNVNTGSESDTRDQSGKEEVANDYSSEMPTRTSKRRKSNDGTFQALAPQPGASRAQSTDTAAPDMDSFDGNNDAMVDSVGSALAAVEAGEASDPDFVMPKKHLEIEQDIESELTRVIQDWESIFKEFAHNENHDLLRRTGWTAQQMTQAYTDTRDVPINISPDIGEDEFEDDPDVANCILGPMEVRRKEAIWITENEDWLRQQQKKMLDAELEAAQDKPKKPKQKRRHHQMGDGSVLEGQPAASAAEAAHKMLKKRAAKQFSNHINYDRLKALFPGGNAATPQSGSGQGASPAASQVTQSPPVAQAIDEEDREEEEEEEQMQELEEEEDLENQYMDDEDEGFGEDFDYD